MKIHKLFLSTFMKNVVCSKVVPVLGHLMSC
jgi:hypothetical protein